MANVLLTQECVRACPYCFAKKHMKDSSGNVRLSWEDLIFITDLFELSQEKHISLLGGEPSLHPQFVDFILYCLERRFHVTVFTSGIMSKARLKEAEDALAGIKEDRLSFVCNLNSPDMSTAAETEAVDSFLSVFGGQTTLSFNIFHLDFDMQYLFDYIERFSLKRHIRLGLAHPIPGQNNQCIEPKDFGLMTKRLVSFVPAFIKHGVSAGFDCGFPLCIFSDAELGKLVRLEKGSGGKMIKFVCNPAIDIGPDMKVWSCFPLSNYRKRSLYEFNSLNEVRDFYKQFHLETRGARPGVFEMCGSCTCFLNESCSGGCLAHILRKDAEAPDSSPAKESGVVWAR